MAAEVFNHGQPVQAGNLGNRPANVAETRAGLHGIDAGHHGFIGDIHQALGLPLHFADAIHARMVAMPAIDNAGHINIGDVAFLEGLGARNAMADHVIERDAGRVAVAAIPDRGGLCAVVEHKVAHQIVQMLCRYTGFHFTDEHVEAFCNQSPGLAHAFEAFRIMDAYFASAHGKKGGCVVHEDGFPVYVPQCGSDCGKFLPRAL